jgi:hypothetical protein
VMSSAVVDWLSQKARALLNTLRQPWVLDHLLIKAGDSGQGGR